MDLLSYLPSVYTSLEPQNLFRAVPFRAVPFLLLVAYAPAETGSQALTGSLYFTS